jgi:Toastrack DUF4097
MVLLAAVCGASAALAGQRTFDKRLDAPPGGRLTFATNVGSVEIVGHEAGEVVLHAELRGSADFLHRLHISAEATPSGVVIAVHDGPDDGWPGWFHWFDSGSAQARFTVEVPSGYPVDLRTTGGDVRVQDLNAAVRAATSGGSAHFRDVAGTLRADTSGGSIEVTHLLGSADLSSSGGSVEVTDSKGDLDLHTSGGSVRLQNDDGKIHALTSGGSIRAVLQSNRGISLDTSGGGITLLLPQDAHASIVAESGGGGITTDFPITTTRIAGESHLVGTIGGGGLPISLESSGGSIHIAPSD